MRPSGLPSGGDVPSSAHILHIFEHGKELLDVCARFCGAGLEAGDCCVWITTPPWTTAIAFSELVLYHVPDARRYVDSGQLHFVAHEDFYLAGGKFDAERVLEKATTCIQEAYGRGWPRVRACGMPCRPGMDMDWPTLLRYEQTLQQRMQSQELLLLCAYRTGTVQDPVRQTLVDAHDAVLHREGYTWRYTTTAPSAAAGTDPGSPELPSGSTHR